MRPDFDALHRKHGEQHRRRERCEADQQADALEDESAHLVTKPEQPGQKRARDRDAKIGQGRRDQIRIGPDRGQKLSRDNRSKDSGRGAKHPSWEE